jgi:hypothetical protein
MLDGGSERDRARFVEYAKAFYGARMLTWFGDLDRPSANDEELVTASDNAAEDVAILDDDTYRAVVQKGAEQAVLNAAETGGFIAVMQVIEFLRCGGCYRPEDGQRFGRAAQYPPGWESQYQQKEPQLCLPYVAA